MTQYQTKPHGIFDGLYNFTRLSKRSVFILCLSAIVLIFILDIITPETLRLGALYQLPIFIIAFHNGTTRGSRFLFLLSSIAQTVTLFSYSIPLSSKIIESIIKPGTIFLIFNLSLHLRIKYLNLIDTVSKDGLTGLLTGKSFKIMVDQEITRQKRYGGAFSLAYLDIDDFKKLNDTRGHSTGDNALVLIAGILQNSTRETDYAARMGGDEFSLLMLHTNENDCQTLCRHLADNIKSQMAREGFNITASIGYASFTQAPASFDQAITKVDKIMYAVKNKKKKVMQIIKPTAYRGCL